MRPAFELERGAHVLPDGSVRFSVWAPRAREVCVRLVGDECSETPLDPVAGGVFAGKVAGARAGSDYAYRLDGRLERPDPVSRHQPGGVHGPSRVVDPRAFRWTDMDWSGVARPDLIFYELHVGTFTPAGSFDAVRDALPELHELGVTALELMPVAEFPGGRNWGYDGVFPYAPQSRYGGPEGLRRLVDAAHGAGLAVFLDVVYNHLGPEGNVLPDFGPYFTGRHQTPWGDAVNFDGPDSDEVRRYFTDNALHWIAEYHLDGLRLDAVHAIVDTSARSFLQELARAFHALAGRLGRAIHLIAESDANDPRLVRGPERGGLGLDAVWSDDFHHAVHAALTGERSGYYADFGGLEPIAKAVSDRFVLDGRRSAYRRRRHGAPARDVPADRFVVCVQNHDQVGNRALGERLAVLVAPGRLRLAAALLLLSPYLPLLFMGEEYGETAPFQYFVDHGAPELLEAVRRGRRAELEASAWRGAVPDPGDPETFERSRLQRERAGEPRHAEVCALYRALLRMRRQEPALRPGASEVRVACDPEARWVRTELRPPRGRAAFAVFHFGERSAEAPGPEEGGSWRLRLSTDDAAFGGAGPLAAPRVVSRGDGAPRCLLPPEAAVFYVRETGSAGMEA